MGQQFARIEHFAAAHGDDQVAGPLGGARSGLPLQALQILLAAVVLQGCCFHRQPLPLQPGQDGTPEGQGGGAAPEEEGVATQGRDRWHGPGPRLVPTKHQLRGNAVGDHGGGHDNTPRMEGASA